MRQKISQGRCVVSWMRRRLTNGLRTLSWRWALLALCTGAMSLSLGHATSARQLQTQKEVYENLKPELQGLSTRLQAKLETQSKMLKGDLRRLTTALEESRLTPQENNNTCKDGWQYRCFESIHCENVRCWETK